MAADADVDLEATELDLRDGVHEDKYIVSGKSYGNNEQVYHLTEDGEQPLCRYGGRTDKWWVKSGAVVERMGRSLCELCKENGEA